MMHTWNDKATPPITAVHVEDSDLDAELFEYYIQRLNLPVQVVRLRDGQEAVDFLLKETSAIAASRTLVVLDLGLPKVSGQDVLKHMSQRDPGDPTPRIVVLSGSSNPRDREECAALGVHAYFVKPFGLIEYESLIVGPIQDCLKNLVC